MSICRGMDLPIRLEPRYKQVKLVNNPTNKGLDHWAFYTLGPKKQVSLAFLYSKEWYQKHCLHGGVIQEGYSNSPILGEWNLLNILATMCYNMLYMLE